MELRRCVLNIRFLVIATALYVAMVFSYEQYLIDDKINKNDTLYYNENYATMVQNFSDRAEKLKGGEN